MKRLYLGLSIALLTFTLGSAASFVWNAVKAVAPSASRVPAPGVKLCPIHGVVMGLGRVPVKHGRNLTTTRYEAEQHLFPNSNRLVDVGCKPTDDREETVYFCSMCRAVQAQWEHEHGTQEHYLLCGSD